MKKKTFRYLAFLAVLMMWSGCNDDNSGDSQIQVKMNVSLDFTPEEPLTSNTRRGETCRGENNTRAGEERTFRRRFIVDAYSNDDKTTPAARKIIIFDLDEEGENGNSFRLPVEMQLQEKEYSLVVWSDYVEMSTGSDYFYNTNTLSQVSCMPDYYPNNAYREAHSGVISLNLAAYDRSEGSRMEVEVNMRRALAPLSLQVADYQQLVEKVGGDETILKDAIVTITYAAPFTGFNVLTMQPVASSRALTFSVPLVSPKQNEDNVELLKDYMFVGTSEELSRVQVSMTVQTADGSVLNKVENLSIPFKRGFLTTVKGNFLTSSFTAGLDVDIEFDEDDKIYDLDSEQPVNK